MFSNRDYLPVPVRRPLITWSPRPLVQPILEPGLEHMPILRRTAVILHYRVAALEYALSPGGALRSFIQLCALLGLMIGIPVLLIVPPVVLLVYALADITAAIVEILKSILMGLLYVIGIVVICGVLVAMSRRR